MHTYLPEEQKKTLRKEYIVRLAIVTMLVGTIVGMAGTIGMLPAYMSARSDVRDKEYQLSDEGERNLLAKTKEIEQQVKYATDFGNRLLEGAQNPSLLEVLRIPNDSIVPGIRLTSFEVSINASSTVDMRVGGISANRESLVTFRKNIESYKGVQKVELPVSDLARSKDLTFIIRIVAN